MSGNFRVWAAVDLLGGKAVRLRQGRPETAWVVSEDPLALAQRWQEGGVAGVHVVDLDAALGLGHNRPVVAALCRELSVPVQVGGGVRSADAYRELRALGASRVVVGSLAVREPKTIQLLAAEDPEGLVVAADSRQGVVVTGGWAEASSWSPADFAREVRRLGCRHLLVTAVDLDGTGDGPDFPLLRRVLHAFGPGVLASGGVGRREELRFLAAMARDGLEGVVVGTALATGQLTFADIAQVQGA
jgi:phosphoribosylformimino-5-aminoimidazole carboxamide ribotide isomerase